MAAVAENHLGQFARDRDATRTMSCEALKDSTLESLYSEPRQQGPRNIPQEVTSGGGYFRGSSDVIQEPKIGDQDVTSAPIGQIR